MAYYDIRQKTNFDIKKEDKVIKKRVSIFYYDTDVKEYKVDLDYVDLIKDEGKIIKLGYVTGANRMRVPIYITRDDDKEVEVYPGQDGIYEFQKEEILDTNNEKSIETNAYITGIKAPKGINYKIDYVIEYN